MTGLSRCLYCTRRTSPADGLAHAFPECIGKNDSTLPEGAVCGPCNGYLGSKLESQLVRYPQIALSIQMAGLPGKSGVPRKELGGIESGKAHGEEWSFRMGIPRPSIADGPDGTSQLVVEVPPGKGFSFLRFRRAIHKIALESLALQEGLEYVRSPEFAAARTYIKNPKPADLSWGFAEAPSGGPRPMHAVYFESGLREIVGVNILGTLFVVDLRNSGDLGALAVQQSVNFYGPEVREVPVLRLFAEGKRVTE